MNVLVKGSGKLSFISFDCFFLFLFSNIDLAEFFFKLKNKFFNFFY